MRGLPDGAHSAAVHDQQRSPKRLEQGKWGRRWYCRQTGPQQPGCSPVPLFQAIRNASCSQWPPPRDPGPARTLPNPDQPAWALRWFTRL